MNKKISDSHPNKLKKGLLEKTHPAQNKGLLKKAHPAPGLESLPDVELAQFFRENGLPSAASLIEDLEQTQAK